MACEGMSQTFSIQVSLPQADRHQACRRWLPFCALISSLAQVSGFQAVTPVVNLIYLLAESSPQLMLYSFKQL